MLYRGALESVDQARQMLASGDRSARARHISKVQEILAELASGLNLAAGGDLPGRLAELYLYMQGRLQMAHFEQQDAPLAEVRKLLAVLLEAWEQCRLGEPSVTVGMPLSSSVYDPPESLGYSARGV
jgi:flagellar protein FliS